MARYSRSRKRGYSVDKEQIRSLKEMWSWYSMTGDLNTKEALARQLAEAVPRLIYELEQLQEESGQNGPLDGPINDPEGV